MIILKNIESDKMSGCQYLEGKERQFEYFLAHELSEEEISSLLAEGWRKFGIQYFRPVCHGCKCCIPLRVLAKEFTLSRSQKRNVKKNSKLRVEFGLPIYNEDIFEIYRKHSMVRFKQESEVEDFIYAFYTPSCPGLQSLYYIDDKLVGVGFIDRGIDCLSSVYFVFDPEYSDLGLGTYSICKEIEYANSLGLDYYYLGYYVEECSRMAYKDNYLLREHYDWDKKSWLRRV